MKTLKFAFFFLLSTAILFSCEKTEDTIQPEQNYKTGPCNEVDIAGQIHNEGLAYLMGFESEWSQITTTSQLTAFIMQRGNEYASSIDAESFSYESAHTIATNVSSPDVILTSPVLSNYEKNLLLAFRNSIDAIDFEDPESLEQFHSNANTLECAVMSDLNVTNPTMVLGAVSVGNRSVEYWSAFQTKNMKPGNEKTGDIDWAKVGKADLDGFVEGGGLGGIMTKDWDKVANAAVDGLAASAKEFISQYHP